MRFIDVLVTESYTFVTQMAIDYCASCTAAEEIAILVISDAMLATNSTIIMGVF